MDNNFSIWILSGRAEIFEWRAVAVWPEGYNVVVFDTIDLLLNNLRKRTPDFILLDWDLIDKSAHPVVSKISRLSAFSEIYIIYLPEDHPIHQQLSSWELSGTFSANYSATDLGDKIREIAKLKMITNAAGIIGRSAVHKRTASILKQIAGTDATVLITGESGTGKELLASAIHVNSRRSKKPFVSVNSAAISESILESELFGHEKGAFTGADRQRAGYFETASGGSIFLDEIGEFKLDLQARLLRVLEQKTYYRLGGNQQLSADVRIICATNRNLLDLAEEGQFRSDLYYRLSVIHLVTEPLRKRPEDIYPLIKYFLSEMSSDVGEIELDSEAVTLLIRYSWPGNVRELKNFISATAYLSKNKRITAMDVEEFIRTSTTSNRTLPVATGKTGEQAGFEMIYRALLNLAREVAEMKEMIAAQSDGTYVDGRARSSEHDMEINAQMKTIQEMEKEMIEKALEETSANRKLAAKYLGIGERTLYRKLKEYGIK